MHNYQHNHNKKLLEIHEDVPANHYDQGLKRNLFQKYWHSKRFNELKKVIKPVKGNLLDIGCHGGTFTQIILTQAKPKQIYGIDVSPSAIEYIKKKIPDGHFEVARAEKLPFKDQFFEAVYCLEVLEHVDDPIASISEIKRVLQKGGIGVILIPSDSKLFKTIWFLWTLHYPIWRHAHVQSFIGNKLEDLIKKNGLKVTISKTFNFGMLKLVLFEK